MRTLLFLLLASWVNLSLAEIIGGHDLGGKFTRVDEAKRIEDIESFLPNVYSMKADTFFDEVQIETDNKNIIHGLVFRKTYSFTISTVSVDKRQIKTDFENVLNHIESKYGEFDKSNAERILGIMGKTNGFYLQKVAESATLKRDGSPAVIMLVLSGDESDDFMIGGRKQLSLSLAYLDSTAVAAAEKAGKSKNDLSGF